MRNILLISGLLSQIVACGRAKDYHREDALGGDPHLVGEYYTKMADFIQAGAGSDDDLKVIGVQYGPLDATKLGLCTYDLKGRVITLRYDLMYNGPRRNLVLTHEMGHCVFNQDHYDAEIDIMNTVSNNESEKEDHFDTYFSKLCSRIMGKSYE